MKTSTRTLLLAALPLALVACSDDDGGNNQTNDNNNNASPLCGNGELDPGELCDGALLDGNDCTTIGQGFTGGTLACHALCNGWVTTGCTGAPACGDGAVDAGEDCDSGDLDGNDCTTIGQGFTGGTLACNDASCAFDTSGCTGGPTCGDGTVDTGEDCDSGDLDGNDCTTIGQGFTGGTLACDDASCAFDTSGCTSGPICGDGQREGSEVCDGADHGGASCADYGFNSGFLNCNPTCDGFVLTDCNSYPSLCGNGIREAAESCDGNDLTNQTCAALGFTGGTLACATDCSFDLSGCTGDLCAEANYYGDGWCDSCELWGGTADPDCATVCSVSDGDCTSWSFLSTVSTCIASVGTEDPDCGFCGDGTADGDIGEHCDGADLYDVTCTDLGYLAGTLGCAANCTYDTSQCVAPYCNDGVAQGFEVCDGTDLQGASCANIGWGFSGGTLACTATCNGWDTSQCTPQP